MSLKECIAYKDDGIGDEMERELTLVKRSIKVGEVLDAVSKKAESDSFRFRTCCTDARACK